MPFKDSFEGQTFSNENNIDIQEIADTMICGKKAIMFPLEIHGGRIIDSSGRMIAEVRGWGWIQYIDHGPKAEKFQDDLGQWIVKSLNEAYEKDQTN